MPQKPGKNPGALDDIREAVVNGRYLETSHAQQRMCEHQISRLDIWHAIENGKRNTEKDKLDKQYGNWCYAIEGPNMDADRKLRMVVVLSRDIVRLITAFPLQER